ncbi:MAG: DUF6940 family protein [Caulobacteraceae bacterium]
MWEARREAAGNGEKVSLLRDGAPVSFGPALDAMHGDERFRALLLAELAAAPHPAFFWELPPIAKRDLGAPFEYVTLPAPELHTAPADPRAFADELAAGPPGQTVTAFANLSGDATLIAPRPLGRSDAYGHLAAFVRGAPATQQHALLALTASEARRVLSDAPLWISTSGLGVFWLHIRLDSEPKYYAHAPYRSWRGAGD